jgi:hypothetical protein
MSALLVGDAASLAVLALSPWLIPLIAVTAKLTYAQTRSAFRSEFPRGRPDTNENGRLEGRPRNQEAPHERIKAQRDGRKRYRYG